MAPNYKLMYFNAKAVGEPIRLLMSYGNIDFEDFRFDKETWPKMKPNMPFGQLPVLELNGIQAHQSMAISRYLAKQVKLTGANDLEDLQIDAIVDTLNDLKIKITVYHYEPEADIKEKRRKVLFEETLPHYLPRLESIAKSNNGHLAAGKFTWADIYFVGIVDFLSFLVEKKLTEDCPTLLQLEEKVLNMPGIKEWVAKRPKTNL